MSNKKGFTLIELIIAIGLFGVGLIAVFTVLVSGFSSMSQARGQVVAINLAREGAETMFNLRDTNLRKRSGKKDLCRLNRKGIFVADIEACENEERLGHYIPSVTTTGIQYVPVMATFGASEVPVMLPMTGGDLSIFDGVTGNDSMYELLLNGSGEFSSALLFSGGAPGGGCYAINGSGDLVTSAGCSTGSYSTAGRFYRTINNVRLYDKDAAVSGGNRMGCQSGMSTDSLGVGPCGESEAKELRFCSEVQYIVDRSRRSVTICSVMTNFKE